MHTFYFKCFHSIIVSWTCFELHRVHPQEDLCMLFYALFWRCNYDFINYYYIIISSLKRNTINPHVQVFLTMNTWIQINHQPDATVFQFIILTFIYSSTSFGRSPAHHQGLNDCSGSLWFYLRIVVIVVLCSWSGRLLNFYLVEAAAWHPPPQFDEESVADI